MELSVIKSKWTNPMKAGTEEGVKAWDSVAYDYVHKEITFENNSFLQLMESKIDLSPDMSVLDVGCGAGAYSIALAPRVGKAVGVDFSPKMIELAKDLAAKTGISNAEFYQCDWYKCDGSDYKGKYDVVFAHTTPAVADYDTFMKMAEAAKKYCFICKPTRRTDMVLDKLSEMAGRKPHGSDDSIAYMFDILWEMGFEPEITYEKTTWCNEKDLETAKPWYLGRLKSFGTLDEGKEQEIIRYLEDIAVEGQVSETINTTLVSISWKVG